jgi:hypothetical protein
MWLRREAVVAEGVETKPLHVDKATHVETRLCPASEEMDDGLQAIEETEASEPAPGAIAALVASAVSAIEPVTDEEVAALLESALAWPTAARGTSGVEEPIDDSVQLPRRRDLPRRVEAA